MKIGLLIAAMLLGTSAPVSAGGDTPVPGTSQTEDVVTAAKEAKKKRKAPASKVITNADVRKSKGRLIVLPASATAAADSEAATKSPAQRDIEYRQRRELEEKIVAAEAKVASLEKELQDVESRYYEENDPDRRDNVIRKKFEETKKQLQNAREELAALTPDGQPTADSQP